MKFKLTLLVTALLIAVSIYLGRAEKTRNGHETTTTTRASVSKPVAGTLITGNPTYTFGNSGSSYTDSQIWQKANKKKN